MRPDVIARAEDLPFADSAFDVTVTRIAPHHFTDIGAAVRELARVARTAVVVEVTLYVDEAVEEAERLRDPTHVRSYTEAEWRGFLEAAGAEVMAMERFEKRRPADVWLARTGCEGEEAERVRALLADYIVHGGCTLAFPNGQHVIGRVSHGDCAVSRQYPWVNGACMIARFPIPERDN